MARGPTVPDDDSLWVTGDSEGKRTMDQISVGESRSIF